jgi:hypothetical protein
MRIQPHLAKHTDEVAGAFFGENPNYSKRFSFLAWGKRASEQKRI